MSDTEEAVRARLIALEDSQYRDFQCRLIPTVDPDTVIGVRTPALRKLAGKLSGTPEAAEFLRILPHRYYEENNLHGFLIEAIGDYGQAIAALDAFLPYVDNWATCDMMRPKAFQKRPPELLQKIREWLRSEHPYTVRFGMEMLMTFYMDGHFGPEHLELVAGVKSQEYYVQMMMAWYFATALAKQYDRALPYLEERRLDKWVHQKTIRKAIESNRISGERKAYLRTLRIS